MNASSKQAVKNICSMFPLTGSSEEPLDIAVNALIMLALFNDISCECFKRGNF